jgi:hypothetical protein
VRVLVACEYSGRVRDAFIKAGHEAWSIDLLPSESPDPDGDAWDGGEIRGGHLQMDVLQHLRHPLVAMSYDLMVAHPPCTHLSVSGAKHFEAKRADGRQQAAIDFFLAIANAQIPRIAIENPVCIMSSVWREPDQIIQPWEFGHGETKATCLWLKGLPPLTPTNIVPGREPRVHRMPPGPDRWKERSRTYEGIAAAMADQWGAYTDLVTAMEEAA